MPCAERDRLLLLYTRSIDDWAKAVMAKYTQQTDARHRPLHLALIANDAHMKALKAKAEYMAHISDHKCRGVISTSSDDHAARTRTMHDGHGWRWRAAAIMPANVEAEKVS